MLNFGLGEMLLIAAVALIFVGPERLPTMLRFLGKQYGKLEQLHTNSEESLQLK